ncbi:MAG: tyrosine-type recombinase/integrase [Chloroflexota bacterium]|nr:tyrosine-type recombinase/integrase [Chloroflexota bacterium]
MRKNTSDNTDAHLTVTTFLSAWADQLANDDHSVHTIRSYRSAIHHFLEWYEAEERRPLELDGLTPITLISYRNYLQHDQGKATSTVNTRVAALRAWCTWLHEHGHVDANPAGRLKSVGRQSTSAPQALTDRQFNALLRAAQHTRHANRDFALLQMMLQTGMRVGECAALNIEDIVFGERNGSVTIRSGKGNKSRLIPLNGSARQALAEYAAPLLGVEPTLKAVATAWPRRAVSCRTPLWRSQKHHRLSESAMRRMIDDLVQNCATRNLVPETTSAHTLRHTFAKNYLTDNPGDLIGLATLLGHNSLDTTRIYVQPSADELAARVERSRSNAYGG